MRWIFPVQITALLSVSRKSEAEAVWCACRAESNSFYRLKKLCPHQRYRIESKTAYFHFLPTLGHNPPTLGQNGVFPFSSYLGLQSADIRTIPRKTDIMQHLPTSAQKLLTSVFYIHGPTIFRHKGHNHEETSLSPYTDRYSGDLECSSAHSEPSLGIWLTHLRNVGCYMPPNFGVNFPPQKTPLWSASTNSTKSNIFVGHVVLRSTVLTA